MDPFQNIINLFACIAASAFFAAFVLTFWPSRVRLILATIFYGIGIFVCLGRPAYYWFSSLVAAHGLVSGYDRLPLLGWLMPILLLCFAIAATVLLWPSISQKQAVRVSAVLFVVFAPLLIFIGLFPDFQFHRLSSFDMKWLLYAILWFRIREGYGKSVGTGMNNAAETLC